MRSDRRSATLRGSLLSFALTVGILAGLAGAAGAAAPHALRPPSAARRPLDVRSGERAAVPATTAAARAALTRRLGIESQVATDPVGGGLRALGRSDGFLSGPAPGDPADVALAYVRAHASAFGLAAADFDGLRLVARYRSNDGVTHLTWLETSGGVPAYDSRLSVHVTADGRIVAASGPPLGGLTLSSTVPRLSASQALGAAKADLGAPLRFPAAHARPGVERRTTFANGDSARLVGFATPGGDRLAWRLTVAGQAPYLYDELIDAASGAVLARRSLTDFAVSNAQVFDYHPGAAAGGTAHTVDLGADSTWLSASGGTKLSGRNAHAYADVNNDDVAESGEEIGPSSGTDWSFAQTLFPATGQTCSPFGPAPGICTWNTGSFASESTNRSQATTQLFYYVNTYHDWLEQPAIGFDDASHNFELDGLGGGDPVAAEADDSVLASGGSGPFFNNANMSTPPDGTSPRMQMYLFGGGFPAVNGADDASVVYHEYTHGLTNRLVDNGLADGLNANQPQAMGEGWSDWYAMDFLVDPSHGFVTDTPGTDGQVVVGAYVTGDTVHGIRNQALDCPVGSSAPACPGSTNAGHVGGFTFADLGRVGGYDAATPAFEVHDGGEIWAETLWDLRTALGATVARTLITDALRLSPPDPSFLDERDAILEADVARYAGAHHDQIWAVFAVRGMGFGARTSSANATRGLASFTTPTLAAASIASIDDGGGLGDGDHVAEPGETVHLNVSLSDPGLVGLTNVGATLASTTTGVLVPTPHVDYGTIAAGDAQQSPTPFAISVPTSVPCGALVGLTLHVTSDQGAVDLPLSVALGSGRTTFVSSDPAQVIPDASPTTGATSTVNVPSGGRIDHLRVNVDVTHAFVGDLTARLTSPAGKTVTLLERPGFGQDGSNDQWAGSVPFDDDAAAAIQNVGDGGTLTGSFVPDEPLAAFSAPSPPDRAGVWTLNITDAAPGDQGTLNGWSLDTDQPSCSTTVPPPPSGGGAGTPPPSSTPTPLPTPLPTPPPAASGAATPTVSARTTRARLDRRNRFAFGFTATPAGLHGELRVTLPKHGRRAALLLAHARFVTGKSGRVRIVLTVRGRVLRRLRQLHTATATVTIALGGRRFSFPLKLTAPAPRRRR